jgi:hypothetical protein
MALTAGTPAEHAADTGSRAPRTSANAVVYPVQPDGTLGAAADGTEPDGTARDLWGLFSAVAGDRVAVVRSLAVYSDPDDTSQASVLRDDTDAEEWTADVNAAWIDDEDELEHTMVHEFGHLLTLSGQQLSDENPCPTVDLAEGCPRAGSVLAGFDERFWRGYGDGVPADDGADADEVAAFFLDHGGFDTFVSEYAASNPVEDVAESWAEFVLSDDPGAGYGGTAAEKVRFFAAFPAFAAERERIRSALGYA